MGRKNKRRREGYRKSLGFDPRKYITLPECNLKPRRNEIWFASLPMRYGTHIQGGFRPVLIVSNNSCNTHSSNVTVIPMTSKRKKEELPTHLWIENGGLPGLKDSMLMAEQVTTIAKTDLRFCVGAITDEKQLAVIEEALKTQLNFMADDPEQSLDSDLSERPTEVIQKEQGKEHD